MKSNRTIAATAAVATLASAFTGQAFAATESAATTSAQDAMAQLAEQGVLKGDGTQAGLMPERIATRAELAKIAQLAFKLEAQTTRSFEDVPAGAWYAQPVGALGALGIMNGTSATKFSPTAPVTQAQLALVVSRSAKLDMANVTSWLPGYTPLSPVTRAQVAQVVIAAQQAVAEAPARVLSVKALNKVTVEVVLSKAIADEEANLDMAMKDLTFDNGLTIVNVPRLKSGSKSSYIVPVTTQRPGSTYTFSFKGKQAGSFASSQEDIRMAGTRSVSSDTFEVESFRADGVTDYGYVIQAYAGERGALAFALDENNAFEGRSFQIISSLRSRTATITPEGGQPIVAAYVPFTQSTDGRQAAKFRLPAGQKLQSGTKYTVSADWFTVKDPTFVAQAAEPLTIASAKRTGETTIEVSLAVDPGDEMLAGRSVKLVAADGSELTATYRFSSRKGIVGIFDVQGGKLQAGAYTVVPVGDWAKISAPVVLGS
ncbi:S-layer homology domain-containing protein [Cohnella soli]|uniref:S-layer homology domain-containing protein n=1 Tax=Cohnella soli TaxID=425005 RepID=A0ABW0I3K6_9BACL